MKRSNIGKHFSPTRATRFGSAGGSQFTDTSCSDKAAYDGAISDSEYASRACGDPVASDDSRFELELA
jgi:hypothetical protein